MTSSIKSSTNLAGSNMANTSTTTTTTSSSLFRSSKSFYQEKRNSSSSLSSTLSFNSNSSKLPPLPSESNFIRKKYESAKQASRDDSGCSSILTECSSTTNASTGSFSSISSKDTTSSTSKEKKENVIKHSKEQVLLFNYEDNSFEAETGDLKTSAAAVNALPKEFFCWFGPSGSVMQNCSECNSAIKEKYVTAGDRVLHPKCFKCAKCKTVLGGGAQYENEGLFYCKSDYLELFSKRCNAPECGKPVDEEYVHVGEKVFHPKCFVCKKCKVKLDGYLEKDGDYYCEPHYHELFAPRCKKCKKLCRDKFYRTTDGDIFHHACFKCSGCGRLLKKHLRDGDKYYCSAACGNKHL